MLDSFFGLPVHPLIIHATVVFVPAAAIVCAVAAFCPRFRRWIGWGAPALAVVALVLVPLSTSSGEELEKHKGRTALIREHAELGDKLIWFVAPLAVLAVVAWFLQRRDQGGSGLRTAVGALTVVAAIGSLVMVALIGHSGAKSAWEGTVNQTAAGAGHGDGDD